MAGSDTSKVLHLNVVDGDQAASLAGRYCCPRSKRPRVDAADHSWSASCLDGVVASMDAFARRREAARASADVTRASPAFGAPRRSARRAAGVRLRQAEKGATPAEAARKTHREPEEDARLARLQAGGRGAGEVLPDADVGRRRRGEGVRQAFGEQGAAGVRRVEVGAADRDRAGRHGAAGEAGAEAIEYLTPPGMTASPVYARVIRVNRGDLIYTAGLDPPKPGTGEEQVLASSAS